LLKLLQFYDQFSSRRLESEPSFTTCIHPAPAARKVCKKIKPPDIQLLAAGRKKIWLILGVV
jgi:hypothetical protein